MRYRDLDVGLLGDLIFERFEDGGADRISFEPVNFDENPEALQRMVEQYKTESSQNRSRPELVMGVADIKDAIYQVTNWDAVTSFGFGSGEGGDYAVFTTMKPLCGAIPIPCPVTLVMQGIGPGEGY